MTSFSIEPAAENPGLLVRLFMANVEFAGSRLALVQDGARLTFSELNERVDQVVAGLRHDFPDSPIVGVHLAPSIEAVVTILAVMKLGGTYVPLEPEHPKARNQAILEAAKPDVIVSGEDWLTQAPSRAYKELMSAERPSQVDVTHDPVLKIVFTSGSTGQPKGVEILKRSLANRLAWMEESYPFQSSDVLLIQKSLALVAAAVEVFQGLVAGVPTVIASRSTTRDPAALFELLERESVSHVLGSPAFWLGLVEHVESSGKTLAALRFATTSAEPISADLARRWLRCFPSVPFLNLYGSTECSSNAIAFDIRELRDTDRSVPIGRAIRNVKTSIRHEDEHLGPAESGSIGELCIGGDCLAAGYLDEKLTRQCFLSDPETGERMLRTGDLAYEREDGNIVLVGRSDNRVSVSGFRVELEEVERALGTHAKVTECAVACMPEDRDGLVGYIVGSDWDVAELRSHLQIYLPTYMLPQYWVSVARLPRNDAGKLDRLALPIPGMDRPEIGISLRPASTPLEELVAHVYCEVLGFTKAGMDDDFHAFGGSSVQAAQILGRLRSAVQAYIPFTEFMAEATPAGLARLVSAKLGEKMANDIAQAWTTMKATKDELSVKRYEDLRTNLNLDSGIDLPAPNDNLSFGQNSLWFFQQLRPESAAYNLPFAYRLSGPLRLDALRAAINDVVADNESLRSSFVEKDGEPIVMVRSKDSCEVDVTSEEITEQGIKTFIDDHASEPFDLARAPLLRASIGSIGRDDNVLVLVVHHVVFDGWSRRVLLDQITANYLYHVQGTRQTTVEPVPYRSFSALQRSWMDSEEASSSLSFWREKLGDVDAPIQLPTYGPRPATHPYTGCKLVQRLDPDLSARIDSFARQVRSTPFVALLVGIKLLLMSKQIEDLIVGVPFVNRGRPEFESTIGYFVNMVVVRTRYDKTMSVGELIELETVAVNEAVSHGSYPFDRLVSDLSVPRSLSYNPIYQVIFNLLGDEWDELSLNGVNAEVLTADNGGSQVDLSIAARRNSGTFTLTWEYCDVLFSTEDIASWQTEYSKILDEMTANPTLEITNLLNSVGELAQQRSKEASAASRVSRIKRLRRARSSSLEISPARIAKRK